MDILAEPSNKATTVFSQTVMSINSNQLYRSGIPSVAMMEKTLVTMLHGYLFPYFSPILEQFNEIVHLLLSNGLIYYWDDIVVNPKGLKMKQEEIGPQVLTMDHLTVGFLACLCPVIFSILVFIGEVLLFKVKSRKKTGKSRA